MLQSKYANQSYGEPTLHVDAKGYVHVYFRSKPAVTCPSEILHAFGTFGEINSASLNLDLTMHQDGYGITRFLMKGKLLEKTLDQGMNLIVIIKLNFKIWLSK